MKKQSVLLILLVLFVSSLVTRVTVALPPSSLSPPVKLTPSDPAPEKRFGASTSLSGTTAIVGAPFDGVGGTRYGAAYLYEHGPNGAWGSIQKLTKSIPVLFSSFGTSVALSGNTAVVGSNGEYATVFQKSAGIGGTWNEITNLSPLDPGNKRFGWATGIWGNTAIVGADNGRAAYIFDRNQGGTDKWGQVKKLTPSGGTNPDRFGFTVAVSGNTAIVGAMYEGTNGPESGAAYIFERNLGGNNFWGQAVRLTPADLQEYDRFGQGIAIDGDTAVVGAWWDDGNGAQTGSVYVFERNFGGPGNWGQTQKLLAQDVTDHFGFSVGVSGNTIVVGAPEDDEKGNGAGATYLFHRNPSNPHLWDQGVKLTPSDGYGLNFGDSVAVSGHYALVGSVYDSQHGYQAGAAYIYTIPEPVNSALILTGMIIGWPVIRCSRGTRCRKYPMRSAHLSKQRA
jgi:hypothetical protein